MTDRFSGAATETVYSTPVPRNRQVDIILIITNYKLP